MNHIYIQERLKNIYIFFCVQTISWKLKPDQQTSVQPGSNMVQRNTQIEHAASTNQQTNVNGASQQTVANRMRPKKPRRTFTKAKKPLKKIDDIKKIKEMLTLFELLGLPDDSENLDLAQMKKDAKAKIEEQSSGSGQYSNGTTVSLRCLQNTLATCLILVHLTLSGSFTSIFHRTFNCRRILKDIKHYEHHLK